MDRAFYFDNQHDSMAYLTREQNRLAKKIDALREQILAIEPGVLARSELIRDFNSRVRELGHRKMVETNMLLPDVQYPALPNAESYVIKE